jgi:hypothetical protein
MVYWAFGLLILFAIVHKLRRLKVCHLEWGLVRLEFEPESNDARQLREPRQRKAIDD